MSEPAEGSPAHAVPALVLHRYGPDAVLVDLPDLGSVRALDAALRRAAPAWLQDVVPAARTVLVRWAPRGPGTVDRAAALVRETWRRRVASGAPPTNGDAHREAGCEPDPAPEDELRLEVVYDGADLDEVASATGVTRDEVVARHAAGRYTVAFGGFAPGFGYLVGLDPALVLPRRGTPRPRVPAGSVAVADVFTGVYPEASPGGWWLLGRTPAVLFDVERDPPALLVPGRAVRFVPVREAVAAGRRGRPSPAADGAARTTGDAAAGDVLASPSRPSWEVLATGPLVLVEDLGRPGHAAVGVPRSGAVDPATLRRVNRAVGNAAGAAALEVLLGGLVLRARGPHVVALGGADCGADLDGVPVPLDVPVRVTDGSVLRLGTPSAGLRSWLAVRGGVDAPPVLGSRSHDVLSGLGPPPVRAGDVLVVGQQTDGWPEPAAPDADGSDDRAADVAVDGGRTDVRGAPATGPVVLGALPGPRADRLALTWDALARLVLTVSPDSNRTAVRLVGPAVPRHAGEVPSEGLVPGAVQLPPAGGPVVFLADHPVTGGYPVVAVLTPSALGRAAQLRPGDAVRLDMGHQHLR